MLVKFMGSGESPRYGRFEAGHERQVDDEDGRAFVARGLAEEVKPKKAPSIKGEKEG